jgi:hypothetical protein
MVTRKSLIRRIAGMQSLKPVSRSLKNSKVMMEAMAATRNGYNSDFVWPSVISNPSRERASNPLRIFFDNRRQGRGIWKWEHYFDVYDRHFRKFRGQEVRVLEIGVYGGGSLDMWRDYFGPRAMIYGVDIEPRCRDFEDDRIKIFIGDQGDRLFWRDFCQKVPALDVVIDDGAHLYEQQIVTFKQLVPFLKPGGIYLCEDVHRAYNYFASYIHGLAHKLNDVPGGEFPVGPNGKIAIECTPFQQAVASIHLYPFVIVLEKNLAPVGELRTEKHGNQWLS